MNSEVLQSNWAIWLALAMLLVALVRITPELLKRTSGSKLKRVLANMKEARKELRKSIRKAERAERKVQKLLARAERVKPRILQDAKNAADDGIALAKILTDKVLVAEAHVRRVIHDEFPPAEHDRLREEHLPRDVEDGRPFSF